MNFKIGALYKFYDVRFVVISIEGNTCLCTPARFNPTFNLISTSFHKNSVVGTTSEIVSDNPRITKKFKRLYGI